MKCVCVCSHLSLSNHVAVTTLDFSGLRFDVSLSVPIPSSLIGLVIVSKADKTVQY